MSSPSVSLTGEELPAARVVSLVVFDEQDVPDPQYTLFNMQWGQIMTHDMSMLAGSTQSSNELRHEFLFRRSISYNTQMISCRKTCNPMLYRRWQTYR